MGKRIHPNYFKASRLIFLAGGLGIVRSFFTYDIISSQSDVGLGVLIGGLLTFGIGWLVKQGHGWIKYLLLGCWIISFFFVDIIIKEWAISPLSSIISLIEIALSIWAMVLMFKVPKTEAFVVE